MGFRPRLPVGESFVLTRFEPRLLRLRFLALRRGYAPSATAPGVGVHFDLQCTGIRTPRTGQRKERGSGSPDWVSWEGGRMRGPFVDRKRLRSSPVLGGDGVKCASRPLESPKHRSHVGESIEESSYRRYVGQNSHEEMMKVVCSRVRGGIKEFTSTTLLEEPQAQDERHDELDNPDSNDVRGSA